MYRALLLIVLINLLGIRLYAQRDAANTYRKVVIADMETRVPLRNVWVSTYQGFSDTTNYRGVCLLPRQFDTLYISKKGYMPVRIPFTAVKDTTYLLPEAHRINEVTIWGKDLANNLKKNVGMWSQQATQGAESPSGRDFLFFLDRRSIRDKKQLKKIKKIFKEWDEEENKDPIMKAYRESLKEKERQRLSKSPNHE